MILLSFILDFVYFLLLSFILDAIFLLPVCESLCDSCFKSCYTNKVIINIFIIIKIPISHELINSYTTLRDSPKCNNASKKSHVRIILKFVKVTPEMFKAGSAQRN